MSWLKDTSMNGDAVDATALTQQVIELSKRGRYSEALPLAERALAIREKALGPDHVDVAVSLYFVATLYQNQGRYAELPPTRFKNFWRE